PVVQNGIRDDLVLAIHLRGGLAADPDLGAGGNGSRRQRQARHNKAGQQRERDAASVQFLHGDCSPGPLNAPAPAERDGTKNFATERVLLPAQNAHRLFSKYTGLSTAYSLLRPQGKTDAPAKAHGEAHVQIKGTKSGLLLHMHERPLAPIVSKLRERLSALPNFYRGGRAVLMLGNLSLEAADLSGITAILEEFGIIADGAVCDSDDVASAARAAGLRI